MEILLMKKLLILLAMACVIVPSADARIVKVAAESNFTTADPPEAWKVSLVEDVTTKAGQVLKAGSVIEGRIVDVVQPKRLKRDASFVFVPIMFYDVDGNKYEIKYHIEGKYDALAKIEAKKLLKTGILTAGNLVVQGISPCYQVVEGVYKNEEGNRLKSGAVAAVDATPLSYYKYGNDLVFKKGQVFKMNMIVEDDEETPVLGDGNVSSDEVQVKEEKKTSAEKVQEADNGNAVEASETKPAETEAAEKTQKE